MTTIIPAGETHLAAIIDIENEAFMPPWSAGSVLGEIGRDETFFALAVDGADVLGFVILRYLADEAELYQIAVREVHRRRGIADRLLSAAMDDCVSRGAMGIWLEVRRGNNSAIALYKKHGFKTEGRRKNYYSSPVEDAVVMAWYNPTADFASEGVS